MRKMSSLAVLIGAVIGLLAIGAGAAAAATSTPRWVTHIQRYRGGISSGVRAYLDPGVARAKAALKATPSATSVFGPLANVQVNSMDSNPPVPQNETQVVLNPNN